MIDRGRAMEDRSIRGSHRPRSYHTLVAAAGLCAVLLVAAGTVPRSRAAVALQQRGERIIPVGKTPLVLAADQHAGRVVVLSEGPLSRNGSQLGDGSVTVLDAARGVAVSTAQQPVAGGPIAVVERLHRAYYAAGSALQTLDLVTGRLVAAPVLPVSLTGLVVDRAGTRLLIAGVGLPDATIRVVDASTGMVARTIALFRGRTIDGIADGTGLGQIVATGHANTGPWTSSEASLFDEASGRLLARGRIEPATYLADDPRANGLIAVGHPAPDPRAPGTQPATNQLQVLDGTSLRVRRTVPLGPPLFCLGASPNGASCPEQPLAVDGRTGMAVAISEGQGDVGDGSPPAGSARIVDPGSGRVLHVVGVGPHPIAVAVDSALGRAYVVNEGDCSVSVVDMRTGALRAQVGVGLDPVALAVDERAGRVFVANRASASVSMFDAATTTSDARGCVATPPPTPTPGTYAPSPLGNQLIRDTAALTGTDPLLSDTSPGHYRGTPLTTGIGIGPRIREIVLNLLGLQDEQGNSRPVYAELRGTLYRDDADRGTNEGRLVVAGSDTLGPGGTLGPSRRLLFTFAALPPGGKQDFRIPVAGVRFVSIGWQVPGPHRGARPGRRSDPRAGHIEAPRPCYPAVAGGSNRGATGWRKPGTTSSPSSASATPSVLREGPSSERQTSICRRCG